MIRARFKCNDDDPRPISWPLKHPYWITGYGEDYATVIAYADDEAQVLALWPDAKDIDSEEVNDYLFTDRFPRPKWFSAEAPT